MDGWLSGLSNGLLIRGEIQRRFDTYTVRNFLKLLKLLIFCIDFVILRKQNFGIYYVQENQRN